MYKLYFHPYSSSSAPMAVLEEIGVKYELHQVDYEDQTVEYRRIQPLGLIPALGLKDGNAMFESAAIILYLCDRHPDSDIAPAVEDPERPFFIQWLFYLADTIYPSYNRYYHPERYTAAIEGTAEVKEQARRTVLVQWQVSEDAINRGGPWILGQRFAACDIYLQMMTTWHETPGDLFGLFPGIRELSRGVLARPACQRAIQSHNFNTGFEDDPGR
jgi:glutathione S-transferase